jgi:ABC-type branched-subunit amino acid transport system substrate-binding protein
MRIQHLAAGLVVALLSVTGLAACGGDDDDNGSAATTSSSAATTPSSSQTTTSAGAATGTIDPSKPPVRLAFISIKIPGVNIYDGEYRGAQAAVKKINDGGGFGGRKLVVQPCNSMAQPTVATVCAQKTLANNPVAEYGCEVSWAATGLKAYARKQIPSFNCVNLPEDFTNPYSYGIHPGQADRGRARYFCARTDIKSVSYITIDIPQQHTLLDTQFVPTIKACGKTASVVYYPATAADLTPSIQQAISKKADFNFINTTGPQTVSVVKGYRAAGIPADKIGMGESSWDYATVVQPLGSALDGAYYFGGWVPWGQTSDPDVQEYLAAMKANGYSDAVARDPNAEYGYAETMFFYAAAKEIGFDQFDAASLKQFSDTNNGLHMPLARTFTNPGPKNYPQVKQPFIEVATYQGGTMTPVTENTDEGWVSAY